MMLISLVAKEVPAQEKFRVPYTNTIAKKLSCVNNQKITFPQCECTAALTTSHCNLTTFLPCALVLLVQKPS